MVSIRDMMLRRPDVYGKLCGEDEYRWRDGEGKPVLGTPPIMLARSYTMVGNKTWLDSSSARNAAIWVMQATAVCNIGRLAEPDEADFPSVAP